MMTTLYKTAVGVGEFVRLEVNDLRQADRVLIVNAQEEEERRAVIIPGDLANLLGFHIGSRAAGPLFMSKRKGAYSVRRVQQITRQVSALAGLEVAVTPEVVRQTRLEHLRGAGMNEEDLKAYVG